MSATAQPRDILASAVIISQETPLMLKNPRKKGLLATVVASTVILLVFISACSGEKTNIDSDAADATSSESESFNFSTYDSSYKDADAFDTLKAVGLLYGEQMVLYDGITSCKSESTTFGTQKSTNGMRITVTIEKDAVDDMPSAILQTALQAAALQKATRNIGVSEALCSRPRQAQGSGVRRLPGLRIVRCHASST